MVSVVSTRLAVARPSTPNSPVFALGSRLLVALTGLAIKKSLLSSLASPTVTDPLEAAFPTTSPLLLTRPTTLLPISSSLGTAYSGRYNSKGRGYPDVSLVASHFAIVDQGKVESAHGTSASAPSWAALVSILNDYRKSQGKPNLGFINRLVYGNGRSALKDITSGSNRGCDSPGYSATAGWDPATGLGTLDFAKLRALI